MLKRDRAGRWRTEDGHFATKAQIARARVYVDASGRKRKAPKTKKGRKPKATANKPKAKLKGGRRGQKLRAAFAPSSPIERSRRRETIRPRKGAPRKPIKLRVNPNALKGTPGDRAQELANKFGIKLRTADDYSSLVELQGKELGRGSFTTEDPTSKEHREGRTILRGVRRALEAALENVEPGILVAIETTVIANAEDLGAETIIVKTPGDGGDEAGVHGIAGGVLASIFGILGQNGYDASDGAADKEIVDDLDVELVVYGL